MRTVFSILIWLYWAFCIMLFCVVITILFLLTFPFDRFKTIPNRAVGWMARMMLKINSLWSFDIRGADSSKIERPTIVVANHQSFLDLPLLYLLPWKMKWVAKKSLFRIPVFGWIIYMTGQIGIDRQSRRSVKKLDKLVEPMQAGIPGMIFPEGTRSEDGELGVFKNGAFVLAERYNFNILPVVLYGSGQAMPVGNWKIKSRQKFVVSVLDPIDTRQFGSVNNVKNRTFKMIESELAKLKETESN